ncbi:MAG: ATP-binding protein [Fibrobacteraceae bacterium]|nr:ATP-binding protein [Fibrobacteraceae bacterium]
MERKIFEKMKEWKNSEDRKPLVMEGARQVGKTWLLKEFGKREYVNVAYVNCDYNEQVKNLFSDFDVTRIIRGLSAITNEPINPGTTLIILDEVQEVPQAITSLKYFCENAPDYHIAVAGSLLGLKIHSGTGFPVGKINKLSLYPLSFMEFLTAMGKNILADTIKTHSWEEMNAFSSQLIELLRQYYFTGGMPEVVKTYVQTQDLKKVREKQKEILGDYELDFSKHAPKKDIPKIKLVWNSIPGQLAKENKKFIYGLIKTGGRAKEFEDAIQWLIDAGLVHKVNRVKKIEMPLKFYEDFSGFKLFVNDLGLLGAMVDAPAADILVGNNVFSNFKGSFTEQYVAQQFFSVTEKSLFYYSNENSTMEIDFVLQSDKVCPVEVKAETNLKAKSLSTVLKANKNLFGIRFSMADFKEQEQMVNVPLPLVEEYLSEKLED